MKNILLLPLLIGVMVISFAQKNELKEIKKMIKNEDFDKANSTIDKVASVFESAEDKYKAKYNFYKATTYMNLLKNNPLDFDLLGKMNNTLSLLDNNKNYASDVANIKEQLLSAVHSGTVKAYKSKDWKKSMKGFEMLYRLSKKDTVYLYSSASIGLQDKSLYDESLKHYRELKKIGYHGGGMRYIATSKITGEEEVFDKKNIRDYNIKLGSHENPKEKEEPSKSPEIVKNIALILVQKGKKEEALKAIDLAIKENPKNSSLILNKADIYYQMGDTDNYKKYVLKAIDSDPKNATLHYNVGVANSTSKNYDEAIYYYKKALELDPKMLDAAMNMSSAYLEKGNILIEEMNNLSDTKKNKKVDWKKYDKLKEEKENIFKKAANALEDYIKNNSTKDKQLLTQLKNIYGAIGDSENFKRIKKILE